MISSCNLLPLRQSLLIIGELFAVGETEASRFGRELTLPAAEEQEEADNNYDSAESLQSNDSAPVASHRSQPLVAKEAPPSRKTSAEVGAAAVKNNLWNNAQAVELTVVTNSNHQHQHQHHHHNQNQDNSFNANQFNNNESPKRRASTMVNHSPVQVCLVKVLNYSMNLLNVLKLQERPLAASESAPASRRSSVANSASSPNTLIVSNNSEQHNNASLYSASSATNHYEAANHSQPPPPPCPVQ